MPPKRSAKSAVKATWEWRNDEGNFAKFDVKFAAAVETKYIEVSGNGKTDLDYQGWKYTFDFDKMVQKNRDSGKERDIQRMGPPVAAEAKVEAEPAVWQWKSDSGKWQKYDGPAAAKLEAAYGESDNYALAMKLGDWDYSMDFCKMQQINTTTKNGREMRRMVGTTASAKKKRPEDDDGGDEALPIKKAKKEASSAAPAPAPAAPAASSGDAWSKVSVASGGSPFHGSGAGALSAPTKVIKKGRGVVDPLSHMQDSCHIYESGEKVYQCMLNQTNIGTNNNKFYVIQLLETDKGSTYYVFTRWGRVGVPGQTNLDKMGSLPAAIAQYCKKFRDKTQNDWNSLPTFHKIAGKYQLMDIDLGGDDKKAVAGLEDVGKGGDVPASKLPEEVQNLMRLIGNKSEMVKSMKELEIDTNKMPLGKISKKQIKEAFGYLSTIEGELKKGSPNYTKCAEASSMFYTLIPHDFGMATPPVVRTEEMLKRKMDLLEILSDLEVASKILEEAKVGVNPLDSSYAGLRCDLSPISKGGATFKRVEKYVANTHGKTHTAYKLSVSEVFEVNRAGEEARYNARGAKIPNKKLLWHGSRATNFMGILSQGLRIAPPEAPVTGYMFGKGVYFADSSSKSANYCHTNPSNNEGCLLLCEVALGTPKEYTGAKYMDKAQPGTDSTTGLGKMCPDPSGSEVVDGVEWPVGKMGDSGTSSTALLYPEYIVYDTAQVRMKYLVRLKFHYGKK